MNNTGRIIKGVGGFYYIAFEGDIYESKATALFRKNNIKLAVGDYVEFFINDDGTAYIKDIILRENIFLRPPVANVDDVFIVISSKEPNINLQLVDRMILLSFYNGIKPTIIVNKTDIDMDGSVEIKDKYENSGFEVHLSSIIDEGSVSEIHSLTTGKTIMFMGVSGVGKSSLISKLIGKDLETGDISKKTSRGKHTTRHVELLSYEDNSYIVDTPGFSSLSLDFLENDRELESYYPEFKKYECKFNNCKHIDEPKCGVKDALENKEIEKFRYENYLYFVNELKNRRF